MNIRNPLPAIVTVPVVALFNHLHSAVGWGRSFTSVKAIVNTVTLATSSAGVDSAVHNFVVKQPLASLGKMLGWLPETFEYSDKCRSGLASYFNPGCLIELAGLSGISLSQSVVSSTLHVIGESGKNHLIYFNNLVRGEAARTRNEVTDNLRDIFGAESNNPQQQPVLGFKEQSPFSNAARLASLGNAFSTPETLKKVFEQKDSSNVMNNLGLEMKKLSSRSLTSNSALFAIGFVALSILGYSLAKNFLTASNSSEVEVQKEQKDEAKAKYND